MQLERNLVYGPVHSRRFGWDLGINLLPIDRKLCTFDCVYCQYGFTAPFHNAKAQFPSSSEIIKHWQDTLDLCAEVGIPIGHTTVSGNGEPTMHPHFPQIAADLVNWRNRNRPALKLAVLSNGYRLRNPAIRQALSLFDETVLKLDSAIPEKVQHLDRPLAPFQLDRYIEALAKCERVVIQTMLIRNWNDSEEDLEAWRNALRKINPVEVQIYTITRTPAADGLQPLSPADLEKIAEETTALLRLPVHAYF